MFTISHIESFSQEIKKSRFIGIAGPVESEQEAKDFLTSHSDATANHNCWAWRIGQNYRFNDDGEPSGTAGKPILQAIDGQQLDNIAVVVTRFFGGILLGSGGLMRAYGGTAASCLRLAEKTEVIPATTLSIVCDFADLALLKARLMVAPHVRLIDENFTDTGAIITASFPNTEIEQLKQHVTDLTRGKAIITEP